MTAFFIVVGSGVVALVDSLISLIMVRVVGRPADHDAIIKRSRWITLCTVSVIYLGWYAALTDAYIDGALRVGATVFAVIPIIGIIFAIAYAMRTFAMQKATAVGQVALFNSVRSLTYAIVFWQIPLTLFGAVVVGSAVL